MVERTDLDDALSTMADAGDDVEEEDPEMTATERAE
jgi:hypothetical protein